MLGQVNVLLCFLLDGTLRRELALFVLTSYLHSVEFALSLAYLASFTDSQRSVAYLTYCAI